MGAESAGFWEYVGYRPTAEQLAVHGSSARFRLVAGGERGGKSYSAAMELFDRCIGTPGLWWIVGPDYEQARAEFDYTVAALNEIGAVKTLSEPQQGQCKVTTEWGGTIETKTSDDVRKLAGKATAGVLMVEAAQQGFDVWLKLRARISEHRGWLWASGTFEGSAGWYAETWQRWQGDNPEGGRSFSLPTWSNLAIFPGGRDDPEIKALEATYPPDLFLERFGAVPCPPAGLVFREFSFEQHVSSEVGFDDSLPVHLAVDPGYAGAYAVLALQELDGFVFVVDEVYLSGTVAAEVIAECKAREWWGKVAGGVIDIAGRQHQGLPSHVEIWHSEAGLHLTSNRVGIVDGIARTRTFLRDPASGTPRILFAPHCKGTFAEFGKYKYQAVAENRPLREEPIDRDNHALKALAYWLYARFGPVEREIREPTPGADRLASLLPEAREIAHVTMVPGENGGVRFATERRQSQRARLFGR